MQKTSIEWVKNHDGSQGYTWNPITGCLNGCPYCYARKLANGRLRERYLGNKNFIDFGHLERIGRVRDIGHRGDDPFYPRFWPERLGDIPLKPPRGIFVCDMGELFGDWLPTDWQERVFNIIKGNPQHRFYLLTKQAQNLPQWSPFSDNCWVGVTVTNPTQYREVNNYMAKVQARIKFISFEPLLGRMPNEGLANHVQWLILGAQTKPTVMPKIEWVQEIVKAADRAGVAVFLKDNLLGLVNYESPETEFAFNKDGYYRQELPKEG